MRARSLALVFTALIAPLHLAARPLTFTIKSEIDIDVAQPLSASDQVWCHLRLTTGDSTSDLEVTNVQATLVAQNQYVCSPSVYFHWGNASVYRTTGLNIVYAADIVDVTSKDPQTSDSNSARRASRLGPSLYPPPAAGTVTNLPAVSLHL